MQLESPEQRPPSYRQLLHFLDSVGADRTMHTHGPLRAHLEGVYALLSRWGCRDAVCLAGLFHSIYGTESFRFTSIPVAERQRVEGHVGAEAERLAFLFGAMKRASLYANLDRGAPYAIVLRDGSRVPLSLEDFAALVTIAVANRLEQTRRVGGPLAKTYRRAIPLLPRAAVEEVLARTRVGVIQDVKTLAKRVLGRAGQRTG